MNDLSIEEEIAQQNPKCGWTIKEKATMLIEAEETGFNDFSKIAQKYGTTQKQLLAWKKQLELGVDNILPVAEYRNGLSKLVSYEKKFIKPVMDKLLAELKSDKLTGYNASCSLNNFVSSVQKFEHLRFELLDRIAASEGLEEDRHVHDTAEAINRRRDMQRFYETCLVEMEKERIEKEQQAKVDADVDTKSQRLLING
jgi:hypothetical protein